MSDSSPDHGPAGAGLCLGTVQFGMDYGVSNDSGRVPEKDVADILDRAAALGVTVLDTAPAYGDSEEVLGRLGAGRRFSIISKTGQFRTDHIDMDQVDMVRAGAERSLERLGTDCLGGLMVHWPGDLLAPGADLLWRGLQDLRDEGLTAAVGVSLYDPKELSAIMERYDCDIVQVPLNVLDQRFVQSGALAAFRQKGGEVFARSAFLQGLLFMSETQIPDALEAARGPVSAFQRVARAHRLDVLQASIGFVKWQRDVDYLVSGVVTLEQLEALGAAMAEKGGADIDYSSFALDDPAIIDPRNWQG